MKPVHARIVHRCVAQTSRKPAWRHGWRIPDPADASSMMRVHRIAPFARSQPTPSSPGSVRPTLRLPLANVGQSARAGMESEEVVEAAGGADNEVETKDGGGEAGDSEVHEEAAVQEGVSAQRDAQTGNPYGDGDEENAGAEKSSAATLIQNAIRFVAIQQLASPHAAHGHAHLVVPLALLCAYSPKGDAEPFIWGEDEVRLHGDECYGSQLHQGHQVELFCSFRRSTRRKMERSLSKTVLVARLSTAPLLFLLYSCCCCCCCTVVVQLLYSCCTVVVVVVAAAATTTTAAAAAAVADDDDDFAADVVGDFVIDVDVDVDYADAGWRGPSSTSSTGCG
jgi:hypothetical protein